MDHPPPTTSDAIVTMSVVGQAPPRSAAETERSREVVAAAPHRTAGDVLQIVPGMFVTQHGGQGKAHQIFYRGFDAIHGQDVELWVGGAPVNSVSNLHGQGYADLHFVMPEVISRVQASPGAYDPRQGDFAIAGSVRFDLGWDTPGATAKLTAGSFGERRLFLAYRPKDAAEGTFGAAEVQSTDGFGPSRAAQRASALAQHVMRFSESTSLRVLGGAYITRYDSAGVLRVRDLEAGTVDRFATYVPGQGGAATRTQWVTELTHDTTVSRSALSAFVLHHTMVLRQNFTGWQLSRAYGDTSQQENSAWTLGLKGHHARRLDWFSPSDLFEVGIAARTDLIDQSQRPVVSEVQPTTATRALFVDADIRAVDVAGYADMSLRPWKRITVRGGVRLDGLGYQTRDHDGLARTAQGSHLGKKVTVDVRAHSALHVLASYGEGFRSPQARSLADGERAPFTTSRSVELGVRWREAARVAASASGFVTWLSDDVLFDAATSRNERVAATRRIGVVAEAVFRPTPWFVSSFSLTWTRASFAEASGRYQRDEVMPYVPQVIGRTDLSVYRSLGCFLNQPVMGRLGFATTSLFERPLPYGQRGYDVFLVDASASLRFGGDHRGGAIEVGLDIFNVLGAEWFDGQFVYASRFSEVPTLVPERHVTVGAPRTVLATVGVTL